MKKQAVAGFLVTFTSSKKATIDSRPANMRSGGHMKSFAWSDLATVIAASVMLAASPLRAQDSTPPAAAATDDPFE